MSFFRDLGRILLEKEDLDEEQRPSKMVIHRLDTEESFNDVFQRSLEEPIIIFKHSLTCPISSVIRRRILQLGKDADPPVYEVAVQSSRSLSLKLERDLGIRHESPQAILLHQQKPIYDASHGRIKVDDIREAVAQVSEAE